MPKNDIIVVLTHVPDQNCAERIAKALIESKLAACVNIGGACQSIYEWQGNIETQTEFPIHIKTSQGCYTKIEKLILEMHPYELPDIITLNVHGGLDRYLQWVDAQLSH
ncbi:MAG: divalent-cation tolerance protein CutA [Methylophilaceae bacterium]